MDDDSKPHVPAPAPVSRERTPSTAAATAGTAETKLTEI